jgi:hypothetical protein
VGPSISPFPQNPEQFVTGRCEFRRVSIEKPFQELQAEFKVGGSL